MSDAYERRKALVLRLIAERAIRDDRVAEAMLAVPRERFVPGVSLDDAYADRAFAIKEIDGTVVSSVSQPAMVAQMLELLDVRPGHAVLEIGTGSGYNAALLAELAGPNAHIVSVDIERDLIDRARSVLVETGYARVQVLDAAELPAVAGPFDRIIVTARATDIDPQWWRLLIDRGKLVVPLDIGYAGERAIEFSRDGDALRGGRSYACAFLRMRDVGPDEPSRLFFHSPQSRETTQPTATTPIHIVARRSSHAEPSMLLDADVVVARPNTVFGIRFYNEIGAT